MNIRSVFRAETVAEVELIDNSKSAKNEDKSFILIIHKLDSLMI